jgi:hypothetical protein
VEIKDEKAYVTYAAHANAYAAVAELNGKSMGDGSRGTKDGKAVNLKVIGFLLRSEYGIGIPLVYYYSDEVNIRNHYSTQYDVL